MSPDKLSGQAPFVFAHREDLYNLPSVAKEHEVNLRRPTGSTIIQFITI